MSFKPIGLSILAFVLSVAVIVGCIFLFNVQFVVGIMGLALLIIPFKIQRKALEEADGTFDKVFAKYIIPALLLIAIVFVVLYFALWC